MILNQAQAEAVYSAMCAFNNIGVSDGHVAIAGARAQEDVRVNWDHSVAVGVGAMGGKREDYETQAAFAAAYSLQ